MRLYGMIHIIGTDHRKAKVWSDLIRQGGDLDTCAAIVGRFENFLRDAATSFNATVFAEELSKQLVEQLNAASVAKTVADELGLQHVYCDPDLNERNALGVGKHQDDREPIWMDRIRRFFPNEPSIIFVCGADHSLSFQSLLQRSGLDARGHCKDWTKTRAARLTKEERKEWRQAFQSFLAKGRGTLIALVLAIAAAAAALLPAGARAGPLTQEAMTQYALDQLADVAVANSRCDIEVPEKYFQTLSLNRQGWTDDAGADLAVVTAYGTGTKAYDAMSKPERAAKCKEIADHYSAIDPTPRPPRIADGPECKKLRDRVIEATGAEFRLVSPSGKRVFFEHGLAGEISISCAVPALPSLPAVFIGWEKGAIPPKAWVTLAAMGGQIVTDEPAATLQDGIKKCYQDALKNKSELSSVELPESKIECQAFTRNGGGVSLSIFADDGKDREAK
jgi:hypothetical protein